MRHAPEPGAHPLARRDSRPISSLTGGRFVDMVMDLEREWSALAVDGKGMGVEGTEATMDGFTVLNFIANNSFRTPGGNSCKERRDCEYSPY